MRTGRETTRLPCSVHPMLDRSNEPAVFLPAYGGFRSNPGGVRALCVPRRGYGPIRYVRAASAWAVGRWGRVAGPHEER